jgi:hypothetical protein
MPAQTHETWFNNKWRPAMGWTYMITCVMDFIVFPIAWNLLQALLGQAITQWSPLTLQGAGLYHMAMGAVVGVTAWQRSREKMALNVQPD